MDNSRRNVLKGSSEPMFLSHKLGAHLGPSKVSGVLVSEVHSLKGRVVDIHTCVYDGYLQQDRCYGGDGTPLPR